MVNGERRERVAVYLSVEQAQLLRMRADNLGLSMSRVLVDSAFRQVGKNGTVISILRVDVGPFYQ